MRDTYYCMGVAGGYVDYTDPTDFPVDIKTIANSLTHLPRFGGHTSVPWTGIHHALLCAFMAWKLGKDDDTIRQTLLHDAHEPMLGFDPPTGVKQAVPELRALEDRIALRVRAELNLPAKLKSVVKLIDNVALHVEASLFHSNGKPEWTDEVQLAYGRALGATDMATKLAFQPLQELHDVFVEAASE